MNIPSIGWNDRPAIVILGAGATRGAEFVERKGGPLPPLDADFFSQVQRLGSARWKKYVSPLIQHAVKILGNNFHVTMEEFFTRTEYLDFVFRNYTVPEHGRPQRNVYAAARGHFLRVLNALLMDTLKSDPKCKYHRRIVEVLGVGDAILSFNYDWLVDAALRRHAHGKWNPTHAYGVRTYTSGTKAKGTLYWTPSGEGGRRTLERGRSLLLLKMHGSMTWRRCKAEPLQLLQRWWALKGVPKSEIVTPEWNKSPRPGVYRKIWQQARLRLRETRAIVVIGYSLPPTDLPAYGLLTVDQSLDRTKRLELVVLANPDPTANSRMLSALRGRMSARTRVMTFKDLEDLYRFLGPSPHEHGRRMGRPRIAIEAQA